MRSCEWRMQRGHFCIFHFHFFPSGPRDGCVRTTRPVFQLPRTLTTTVDANTIPLLIDRLCYRYPSFLVDAVTEHVPNERVVAVSYTHLRAHETRHDLVCRLLLE